MSAMGNADLILNDLSVGDDVTLKTTTGPITRKIN